MPHLTRSALAMALLATLAAPVGAVTVNDMVAWSAAGKPLRMDIELGDVSGGDISLRVGTSSEHARLGVTRPSWADSVRFQTIRSNGKVIIRALGSEPVNDAFISLVVEIRTAGDARLQQLGSRPGAGAPLVSPSAQPEPAKTEARVAPVVREPSPESGRQADPSARPFASPEAPVQSAAAPAPIAKVSPKPVDKPAPAAAPAMTPVPAPLPATTSGQVVDMPVVDTSSPAAGPDTAEALAQERTALEQGLESAKAQVADIESRLQALAERERALSGETAPADVAVAEVAETAAPADNANAGARPSYEVFSNVMFVLIGLILIIINVLSRARSGGQDPLPDDVAPRAASSVSPVLSPSFPDHADDGIVSVKVSSRDSTST